MFLCLGLSVLGQFVVTGSVCRRSLFEDSKSTLRPPCRLLSKHARIQDWVQHRKMEAELKKSEQAVHSVLGLEGHSQIAQLLNQENGSADWCDRISQVSPSKGPVPVSKPV
jgi:hypothetical protein